MRLTSISLISWLSGLTVILVGFFLYEGDVITTSNIKGVLLVSLAVTALMFALAYAPLLFWLRKRLGGCRPAALFPLTAALVINIPVFLIGILAIGRTLVAAEAFAFISAFILMGSVFGLGFVWSFQDRDIKSAAWR